MFDSIFNASGETAAISWEHIALTILVAFALGLFISFAYMQTYKKGVISQSFVLTLVMLPVIIALIIALIGSNVARAFSLAGAFSIIRFRTSMGDPKDIAYVFLTMAIGLSLGVGFIGYAVAFTIVLCGFMFLLSKFNFGISKSTSKTLKIVIPEDLDYEGAFDDLFEKYTTSSKKLRTRTTDLGSLYELMYVVNMKPNLSEKSFIDELRCRNGNLSITLTVANEYTDY